MGRLVLIAAVVGAPGLRAQAPRQLTPEPIEIQKRSLEDRQQMMDALHIAALRPGVSGSNPQAPNYANYDEAKANPYPALPDPLLLKNGKKVTTAAMWWNQRRPEIVEDFDREVYGRVPKVMPKVVWRPSRPAAK